MTTTTEAERILERGATRRGTVPERLGRRWRTTLAGGDAAVVFLLALVALNGGSGNRPAAAVLTAALVCLVFRQCGFYKRSYAVLARDEAYFACAGVAIAAIPVLLILATIGRLPVVSIVLTLILAALGTSVLRVRAHLQRHPSGTAYAGRKSITPGAWHDRESPWFRLGKRIFDVTVAASALVIVSPIMLLSAVAIVLESGAPVFFRQQRVGENERPFSIFKFRTMRINAGSQWVQRGDNRITPLGAFLRRTSIDELPQLLNVLRGEMSIVGPRPEMISFAEDFSQRLPSYAQRHVVAPGITGWAQLYLKRNLQPADIPEVLAYDLFYVEHASVLLDLVIVLKTAAEFLFHGAV